LKCPTPTLRPIHQAVERVFQAALRSKTFTKVDKDLRARFPEAVWTGG
jgi:hypothetical protein